MNWAASRIGWSGRTVSTSRVMHSAIFIGNTPLALPIENEARRSPFRLEPTTGFATHRLGEFSGLSPRVCSPQGAGRSWGGVDGELECTQVGARP
jgi:hypothetical protein